MRTHRLTDKEELAIATNGLPIITDFFPDEGQQWGSLNVPATGARYVIGDTDFYDISNLVIFPTFLQQPPGPTLIATLPAGAYPIVWASFLPLNNASYNFVLGANGHLYQVSVAGVITDIQTVSVFTLTGTTNMTQTITALSSTANIIVGEGISGTGIPANTIVTQILSGTSILISHAATTSSTGVVLTFTPPIVSSASDITSWQGTEILFSDLANNSVYQWNGTLMTQTFANQPAQYLTVFSGRLWFTNGLSTVQFTAGGTFNSLGGDAGAFTVTEDDCPGPIIGLKPAQGVLYVIGISWAQMIGNLSETTIGVVSQLSFTRNTAINEVGSNSKWSIISYEYLILWANQFGIWGYYGASAQWMSELIGGFFQNINAGASSLSAAFGYINQLPCLLWCLQWNNPNGSATEYTILALDTTGISNGVFRWFRFLFGNISFITSGIDQVAKTQKVWGFDTSGNIYLLFSNAVSSVASFFNTKLLNFGTRIRVKSIERAGLLCTVSSNSSLTLTALDENLNTYPADLSTPAPSNLVTWAYANGSTATWKYSGGATATWFKNKLVYGIQEFDLPLQCKNLGLNFSLTGVNAYIYAFGLEYAESPADWGA